MTPLDVGAVALVTVDEAAARLGVPAATIRQWKRRYKVRSTKVDGRLLLALADLWDVEHNTRKNPRGRARHNGADLSQ
ncbi:MerR family transcriptional regulator [Terrabacter terrigena]|uniref:MerR family transcriptional regulator n=1 Tax=Terrabacter terrigena TaxID=574718 RepID=A0ABW3MWF0_9MICO